MSIKGEGLIAGKGQIKQNSYSMPKNKNLFKRRC